MERLLLFSYITIKIWFRQIPTSNVITSRDSAFTKPFRNGGIRTETSCPSSIRKSASLSILLNLLLKNGTQGERRILLPNWNKRDKKLLQTWYFLSLNLVMLCFWWLLRYYWFKVGFWSKNLRIPTHVRCNRYVYARWDLTHARSDCTSENSKNSDNWNLKATCTSFILLIFEISEKIYFCYCVFEKTIILCCTIQVVFI